MREVSSYDMSYLAQPVGDLARPGSQPAQPAQPAQPTSIAGQSSPAKLTSPAQPASANGAGGKLAQLVPRLPRNHIAISYLFPIHCLSYYLFYCLSVFLYYLSIFSIRKNKEPMLCLIFIKTMNG